MGEEVLLGPTQRSRHSNRCPSRGDHHAATGDKRKSAQLCGRRAEAEAAYGIQDQLRRKDLENATADAEAVKAQRSIVITKDKLDAEIRTQADAQNYQKREEAKAVGYCIADRLSAAYEGDVETGLFFTGATGYKVEKIISVKELMEKLTQGE